MSVKVGSEKDALQPSCVQDIIGVCWTCRAFCKVEAVEIGI